MEGEHQPISRALAQAKGSLSIMDPASLGLAEASPEVQGRRSIPVRKISAEVPAVLRALLRKSHAPLHAGLDYSFHVNIPTLCICLIFQIVQLSLLLSRLRKENGRRMFVVWE